jgi:hypothetical protein
MHRCSNDISALRVREAEIGEELEGGEVFREGVAIYLLMIRKS